MRKMAILLFSLASFSFLLAKDWNQFRGPTGQGHSEWDDLPLKWNRKDSVDWKTELQGKAWSSPIWVSGLLILTNAIEEEGELALEVLALDSANGKKKWEVTLFEHDDSPRIHKKNSHASPTPVVTPDEKLYVHFGHQGTACLDLSGRILWTNRSITYPPVHGNGCSPMVVGNKLFFSCDGAKKPFVIALDRHTGKVAWRKDRNADAKKKFAFCTALLIKVDGRQQIISPGGDVVVA